MLCTQRGRAEAGECAWRGQRMCSATDVAVDVDVDVAGSVKTDTLKVSLVEKRRCYALNRALRHISGTPQQ
jgi:hypothetical protein